jgi:hypothetical protein
MSWRSICCSGRIEDGIRLSLEGESDVEECGERLYGPAVLRMVQEISLTILISWVPLEYVEVGVVGALRCL